MNICIEKVIEVINNNVKISRITLKDINSPMKGLGIDSIEFIRIVVACEEMFDCEIPDEKLIITEMETIKDLHKMLIESKIQRYCKD